MGLSTNLRQDAVKVLRILEPVVVESNGTVGDAIALMQEQSTGCVVVTEDGKAKGVFTERDVLTRVVSKGLPPHTPIMEVATSPPEVIEEGCSVARVIQKMHKGGYRHMPVVDASNRLRGVVSVKRVVEYLVEHFPETVFNLPPDPGQEQLAREGA